MQPKATKKRISADVDHEFIEILDACAEALKLSRAQFIMTAVEQAVSNIDTHEALVETQRQLKTANSNLEALRAKRKNLEAETTQLSRALQTAEKLLTEDEKRHQTQLEQVQSERDATKEALAQVANRLGVRHTATHCRHKIDEMEQSLQATKEQLGIAESERDNALSEKETALSEKKELSDLITVIKLQIETYQAALKGYKTQGFWGRLFRREPTPVEAEPADETLAEV